MAKDISVTRPEPTKLKVIWTFDAEDFIETSKIVYNKTKNNMPAFKGYRKGKTPKEQAERQMDKGLKEQYFNTIADVLLNRDYVSFLKEKRIKPLVAPNANMQSVGIGKDLIVEMELVVRPEITLKRYTGIEVEKIHAEVDEKDIEADIYAQAKKNATLTTVSRYVQATDIVTINFKGFINGIAFQGGEAKDYKLEIGSGQFIPGFEEQLIGWHIGKKDNINIKFPEQYHPQFAGKDAVFEIELTHIQEQKIPDIDDELAIDLGFETLEELRENVRQRRQKDLDKQSRELMAEKILKIILEENKDSFGVPRELMNQTIQQVINEKRNDSPEEIMTSIKMEFIIDAIAEDAKIDATEEDVQNYYQSIANTYNVPVENITANMTESLKLKAFEMATRLRVIDFLLENCIESAE